MVAQGLQAASVRGAIRCALFLLIATCAAGETLRLATYNLQNYGLADRMTTDGYRTAYPKPEEQKRALRRVIVALQADILVVQEIGAEPYVEELRRDLRRDGVDYPHWALVNGPDLDRHVALLSKLPITSTVSHVDLRFRYFGAEERVKRGLLEAHFDTAAGDLAIFGVHLKSRLSDREDDPLSNLRRTGEAVAVRDAIIRRMGTPELASFVLLGDFNDERGSTALERLSRRGRAVVVHLVPAADSRGEVWTHHYRRHDSYSRVDHVFVSPALRPAVAGGRARIYDGPGVRGASDHRPVVVTLELTPRKK